MGMLDAATCLTALRKVEAGSTFHATCNAIFYYYNVHYHICLQCHGDMLMSSHGSSCSKALVVPSEGSGVGHVCIW